MKYIPKHQKKKNPEIKKRILEGISIYMLLQGLFAMLTIDSESNIPIVLLLVSLGWWLLLILANKEKW